MTRVVGMKVEGISSPVGIGTHHPRFSWRVESDIEGFEQEAYRLQVFAGECVYDSGEVRSSESLNIECPKRMKALTRYRWTVSVLFNGEWHIGESTFETGMLDHAWSGEWIAGIHNGDVKQPVNYLRKRFQLDRKPLRAVLYSTALGVYDCAVNGCAVSDECFAPGWTDYFFRVQHQTYDVTDMLKVGDNAIAVRLGEGWYSGTISRRRNSNLPSYGTIPVFLAELHIHFDDGTTTIIPTDDTWRCSIGGPVRFSDIYDGELYDASYSLGDWTAPSYSDEGWSRCLLKNRRIAIWGRTAPPVKRTELRKVHEWRDIAPSLWRREPNIPDPHRLTIVDFGQNLVGRIRMRIRLPKGASISIRHGEMLNADGSLFLDNLRSARAAINLVGNGEEFEYEPLFTFFGFRYIQITNLPDDCDPATIVAAVMHSDLERTGRFRCSNELLNKFYENQLWSNRGNYLDIPTDCPQRDERLGWLADAWIFADTASYNFDIQAFFEKYLEDVNTSRTGAGEYPQYAPFFAVNHLDAYFFGTEYYKGHSAWADAAIICPWLLYRKYNDRRILERHYGNMCRWIHFQEENSDNLLRCSCVWRDWLNHGDPTSETLISTAFFAYGTGLMAKIASILGKDNDAAEFNRLAANIRAAFQKRFVGADGRLTECSQTAALLALEFGLDVPHNGIFLKQLTDSIAAHGDRLTTGFIGTPFLLPVLNRFGRGDVAAKLLMQKEFPSWLYPVLQGATTIWERWDGYTKENGILPQPMNSFNHYAYGAAASFLYGAVGGIQLADDVNGFRKFVVAPQFIDGLEWAETEFDSPYGTIRTAWRKENGSVALDVTVPPNTTAILRLNGQEERLLKAGMFRFNL